MAGFLSACLLLRFSDSPGVVMFLLECQAFEGLRTSGFPSNWNSRCQGGGRSVTSFVELGSIYFWFLKM